MAVMPYRLASWQQSHGGTSFFLLEDIASLVILAMVAIAGLQWVLSWPSWMVTPPFGGSPWPSPWAPMACHTWHIWVGPRSYGATPMMGSWWSGKPLPGCLGHGPWSCSSWQSGSWWQAWWSSWPSWPSASWSSWPSASWHSPSWLSWASWWHPSWSSSGCCSSWPWQQHSLEAAWAIGGKSWLVTLGTERPRLAIVAQLITTWLPLFLSKHWQNKTHAGAMPLMAVVMP